MTTGGRSAEEDLRTDAGRAASLPPPEIVRRRRHFARHLLAFVAVDVLLVGVWLAVGMSTGTWFFWPVFVIVGWGLLLDVHAWWAYGRPSRRDAGSRSAR
jgi:hypothetical protein